jgi:hypothetical protein
VLFAVANMAAVSAEDADHSAGPAPPVRVHDRSVS